MSHPEDPAFLTPYDAERRQASSIVSDDTIRRVITQLALLDKSTRPTMQGVIAVVPLDAGEIEQWNTHFSALEDTFDILEYEDNPLYTRLDADDFPIEIETLLPLSEVNVIKTPVEPSLHLQAVLGTGEWGVRLELRILIKDQKGNWIIEKADRNEKDSDDDNKKEVSFSPLTPVAVYFSFKAPYHDKAVYAAVDESSSKKRKFHDVIIPTGDLSDIVLPKEESVRMLFWQLDRLISKKKIAIGTQQNSALSTDLLRKLKERQQEVHALPKPKDSERE